MVTITITITTRTMTMVMRIQTRQLRFSSDSDVDHSCRRNKEDLDLEESQPVVLPLALLHWYVLSYGSLMFNEVRPIGCTVTAIPTQTPAVRQRLLQMPARPHKRVSIDTHATFVWSSGPRTLLERMRFSPVCPLVSLIAGTHAVTQRVMQTCTHEGRGNICLRMLSYI